ncbi:unnamed protein product, partial [Iphiclides podalirius]
MQRHANYTECYLLPVYQATSRVRPEEVSSIYAKLKPAEIPITSVSTKRRPITRPSACTGADIANGPKRGIYTGAHVTVLPRVRTC